MCSQCGTPNPSGSKFCNECGQYLTSPAVTPLPKDLSSDEKLAKIQKHLPDGLTEKILAQRDRIEGERRHVTIMFVDMKGFTPLTEKLGPEETFSLMDQVFEIIIHRIYDYGGTVNELRGDGVLAFFGAPIALEDAPQRAIRSSLAIHRELIRFNEQIKSEKQIPPVLVRIGINSGPVVVGSLGNDLRVQFVAVGDTINMAARMEQLADPGTTFVTEDTFRLTEGFFRFEALGEREIKGKEKRLKVYRVIASNTRRTRFDVSAAHGLTRFIGRERELEILVENFERAKAGRGQAVSIVGEAGMGKSRLLYEFRKAMADEEVTFLEGKCLSYSRGVAYHPIIDILKSFFGIEDGESDSEINEKVRRGLTVLGADETSTLPYLLGLLAAKGSGLDKISVSFEARKEGIIGALQHMILKDAERRPVVCAIEDLHWMDRSSAEAVRCLLESIPGARVLMLFTYRPEFVPGWGSKSFHTQVNVNGLSNRESLAMAADFLGSDSLAPSLRELILEKTQGVPFFIEDFVRSLKDMGIIEQTNNTYHLPKNVDHLVIPSTIQDVIMARVDLLPPGAEDLLRVGSVIEREFSYDLINAVMGLPEPELAARLAVLKDLEFIYEKGVHPCSTFVFKHALVQEVCYQSLVKRTCQEHHKTIAQVLEERFPEISREQPEILARHFTEAGLVEHSIPYWQKAGEIAIQRSANPEATDHFGKALELVQLLPESPKRNQLELQLQLARGPALMATAGYANTEVEAAYMRARELCHRLGETSPLFPVLRGLWGIYVTRGDLPSARELGRQCLTLAGRSKHPVLLLWSYYMVGTTLAHMGEPAAAIKHLDRALRLYDAGKRNFPRSLQDPGVWCLGVKAVALWLLGFRDQALKATRRSITLAHTLSHPFSEACALDVTAMVLQLCHEVREVLDQVEVANALWTDQRVRFWYAWGNILGGWALAADGRTAEGIDQMRRSLDTYRSSGAGLLLPYFLGLLADAYGKAGNAKEGLSQVTQALSVMEKSRENWCEAELLRLKGELLLQASRENFAEAEDCFRRSRSIARRQSARIFELRTTMSLCRLWQQQEKVDKARRELAEIYGSFTEGFEGSDLKEAKALLGDLGWHESVASEKKA
jgi:class 3 adenylate cyclase/predicted ATPase